VGLIIGQDRYAEIRIAKFFAVPVQGAKFGRVVQTLARLELQALD
jgi:hypothetical protein